MKDVMLLIATSLPEDRIIENLERAIAEYKSIPSEKNKHHLLFHCQLLLVNHATGGSFDKMQELSKEMDTIEKAKDILTPGQN